MTKTAAVWPAPIPHPRATAPSRTPGLPASPGPESRPPRRPESLVAALSGPRRALHRRRSKGQTRPRFQGEQAGPGSFAVQELLGGSGCWLLPTLTTPQFHWHTATMDARLRVHEGGSGEPLLVLLHGLGATGAVWDRWRPLLAQRWPGRWLAPDLPGHGGSPPLTAYTFDALAARAGRILRPNAHTVVLGHSLGGVGGLALASGKFPVHVQAVIGLGIKIVWTRGGLGQAQAGGRRPPAWVSSRRAARARHP